MKLLEPRCNRWLRPLVPALAIARTGYVVAARPRQDVDWRGCGGGLVALVASLLLRH